MNAAETIQAAIDKLEVFRKAAQQGPWTIDVKYPQHFNPKWDDVQILTRKVHPDDDVYDRYLHHDGSHAEDTGGFALADADLIVTLHRTIDAQLAILRSALADIARWLDPDSEYGWEPQDGPTPRDSAFEAKQALARAILGEVTPDAS